MKAGTDNAFWNWRKAVLQAAVAQFAFLFLFAIADHVYGDLLMVCLRTSLAFWAGSCILLLRRRKHPTPSDLFYLRWGYWLLCVAGVFLTKWIWIWRGLEQREF